MLYNLPGDPMPDIEIIKDAKENVDAYEARREAGLMWQPSFRRAIFSGSLVSLVIILVVWAVWAFAASETDAWGVFG